VILSPREGGPYLRAYLGNLGVADAELHVVHAEWTRSGEVPALARFGELTARSLAAARTALTELAGAPSAEQITDLDSRHAVP
jgi:FMN-dependent NADH-azoreductase